MFDPVLWRMRGLVRTSQYFMTVHGHEEMETDLLNVFDVEHCILTGRIVERQKDDSTGDWKYVLEGETDLGHRAVVVSKITINGNLVIITVYLAGK